LRKTFMSGEGRPRRSAAASNKAWATLMSKGGHEGEEDFVDETAAAAVPETPRGGVKRSSSKEQANTPGNTRGRKKKSKLSESGETDSEQAASNEQMNSPPDVKPVVPKPGAAKSPKKLLPTPKFTKVTPQPAPLPQGNDNIDMIHQDFDRHQADLVEKMEEDNLEEEEEMVPAQRAPTKIPPKSRGRPSIKPPPAMTGFDDPKDQDYQPDDEDEQKPVVKKRVAPKPRQPVPQISPINRQPQQVTFRPHMRPTTTTIVVRPAPPPTRVIYPNHPNRFPTIVNGGPRVVQPRYISQPSRNINQASLRQPVNSNTYETPANVLKEIEKLTEDCKKVSSPEVVSAFQLVDLLREELERMQQHIRETNQYYKNFIEDLQAAAASQFESSQNRTNSLESRITSLEGQLKKCSAVAHQKLLKTAIEGFRTNVSEQPPPPVGMSPQKNLPPHYGMMEGEASGMEQHMQPRDYLVQEEDYNNPAVYYSQDAAIQEASKELDNML
jgi:hypothetical protein